MEQDRVQARAYLGGGLDSSTIHPEVTETILASPENFVQIHSLI